MVALNPDPPAVSGLMVSARTTGLLTLLAMLAFAANSLLCRLALGQGMIDAASLATLRIFSGALVLLLLSIPSWRRHGRPASDWRTGICLFLYMFFFAFAYRQVSRRFARVPLAFDEAEIRAWGTGSCIEPGIATRTPKPTKACGGSRSRYVKTRFGFIRSNP